MPNQPGLSREVVTGNGTRWKVYEMDARHVPNAPQPRCLIAECGEVRRRIWVYPPEWSALSDSYLASLCGDLRTGAR